MQQFDSFLQGIAAVDSELARILPERDSLRPAIDRLDKITSRDLLVKESLEERRMWQDVGLFYYKSAGRLYDAIAVFSRLYERICEEQQQNSIWLPKGMPLVWIADCHNDLGHQVLSARYLLLTAASDAIRDRGVINPNGGVYFRAVWHRGWTGEDLRTFYSHCFTAFSKDDALCSYPEHILSKVAIPFVMPYATTSELDIYEVNKAYASKILDLVKRKREAGHDVDGKDLERLATYLLGAIPGFEVRSAFRAGDTEYDGIVRNTGPKYDFRADLGFYLLVECKDWKEPVGVPEVSQFINKLVLQDCRGGILFSALGITGDGRNRDAELQLLKAHYRAGKVIIVLSQEDFRSAASGKNLVSMLRDKYESVRFDIERPSASRPRRMQRTE